MTVIRRCPCGNVGTPDVPCAGFPGVWNEERGDFERGACLGEVVEYVPAKQLAGAVDLIRELADCAGKGKPAGSMEEQVWNDRAWVIKRCRDYLDGQ